MMKSEVKREKARSKQRDQDVKLEDSVKEEDADVKQEHEEGGPKRWFEDSEDDDNQNKWEYMEHHGVIFPDPYLAKGLTIEYKGIKIKLQEEEEEMAWYWAQSMGTDYEQSKIYRDNFEKEFRGMLQERQTAMRIERNKREKEEGVKVEQSQFEKLDFKRGEKEPIRLDEFDFTDVRLAVEREKEDRKNKPDDEKNRQKAAKEEMNRQYGLAIVDGTIEKVNGYQIQPPTLFKGRGQHPLAGRLKPRIHPETVTLNLADDAPIPRLHVPGHNWGSIECKKDSTWLCSYKNDKLGSSSSHKYIFLAANSRFKAQNDRKKYEKARRLKRCIDQIRKDYMRKIEEGDAAAKQLGTATYLIDKLALRVGNEKGEDEADTQGCCSLRVEHIEALEDNEIRLDFLGKDSMRYVNTIKVPEALWKNIKDFRKYFANKGTKIQKKEEDKLFDAIDTQNLNDYLKSQMEGLTAKVFRTYNASQTLQQQLKKFDLRGLTLDEKVEKYVEANKQVAILCNHQKTVGKKVLESLNKKEEMLEKQRQYLQDLKAHEASFKKKDKVVKADTTKEVEGLKPLICKFPETKDATTTAIKKWGEKIVKEEKALKKKNEDKEIALGTSKTNYNDPRISVAWCKKNQVRIQKVFQKTLLSKFLWAMYVDEDYEF